MKMQAIILAGGSGTRFGGGLAKQFIKISGRTVLERSMDVFENSPYISSYIIVVHEAYHAYTTELVMGQGFKKLSQIVKGGENRSASSQIGLDACDSDTEGVLIHDAVRPFLSDRMLDDIVAALQQYDAVNVAVPCTDTIIKIGEGQLIEDVPPRKYLMQVQTPQAFKLATIKEAYRLYQHNPIEVSDDCSLVLHFGLSPVYVVKGEETNIKITYAKDIELAETILGQNHDGKRRSE